MPGQRQGLVQGGDCLVWVALGQVQLGGVGEGGGLPVGVAEGGEPFQRRSQVTGCCLVAAQAGAGAGQVAVQDRLAAGVTACQDVQPQAPLEPDGRRGGVAVIKVGEADVLTAAGFGILITGGLRCCQRVACMFAGGLAVPGGPVAARRTRAMYRAWRSPHASAEPSAAS